MGTQGTGRKRSTKKERSTAEDDALNLIAREAEARLAAKRAARAEAREIRMKELERQQKELSDDDERMSVGSRGSVRVEDRDYLEKGSRAASALTAGTLTSLGGTSSRRGSGETAITVDAESSLREIKDALVEVEEKYRKAMVSNAQLDNEKNNLMYQVDTLKDSLMELEELLAESRRGHEEKCKDYEREKHAHTCLQFQFNEMKETLKQSEELLNDIRQLRIKEEGFVREISDLQETVEWKDKKIGALERQKEYTDAIRVERDELREEVVKLKDILKKHGIVLGPDLNINGEVGETEVDGTPGADAAAPQAQDLQTSPPEGNSMLGNTEETQLRSSGEEEVDPEQHQEKSEEAKDMSSETLCSSVGVSTLEASSEGQPTEELQTPLEEDEKTTTEKEDDVGEPSPSKDLSVVINDQSIAAAKDIIICTPELQGIVTSSEENVPETETPEVGDLEEAETKSSRVDTHSDNIRESCNNFSAEQENKREQDEESHLRNTESCHQQKVAQDVVTESSPDESVPPASNGEPQQEPENAEEAENEEAEVDKSTSQPQGAAASGKKKKRKRKGKKKGATHEDKNQQKDEVDKEKGQTEMDIKSAVGNCGPSTKPEIDSIKESKMDEVKNEQDKLEAKKLDGVEAVKPTETLSPSETLKESTVLQVTDDKEQTLETGNVEEAVATPETFPHIETPEEVRVDHVKDDQSEQQTLEIEKVEVVEAMTPNETLKESTVDQVTDEHDKVQTLETENVAEAVAATETFSHVETPNEVRVDHVTDDQSLEQSLEIETVETVEAVTTTETPSPNETLKESTMDQVIDEHDKEQISETENIEEAVATPETFPHIETPEEVRVDHVKDDQNEQQTLEIEKVEVVEAVTPNETPKESAVDQVTDEHNEEQTSETENVEEAVATTETFPPNEVRVDHVTDDQTKEQSLEIETGETVEAVTPTETFPQVETYEEARTIEQDREQKVEESITSPVPEADLSISDLIDNSKGAETADGQDNEYTSSVDNSKSETDISTNDNVIHTESKVDDSVEDEVGSIDEIKSECTTNNNPQNTLETSSEENTEAESHDPSSGDIAADESESTSKDNVSVSTSSTDCLTDALLILCGSEPPSKVSAAVNASSDETPIEVSERGPDETAETGKDEEKPRAEVDQELFTASEDGKLKEDRIEKEELNKDLQDDEVEPDGSHDTKSCDSASLTKNTDELDSIKNLLETEELGDVESQTSQCGDHEITTPDSEIGSSTEQDHSTQESAAAEDPQHKNSQSQTQQLPEPSTDEPEDEDSSEPALKESDEEEGGDDEGQSFDFDDMDMEEAVAKQEEVEEGVEVMSDGSNNGSSGPINRQDEPVESIDEKCRDEGADQVDTLDPPDNQKSLADEDAASEKREQLEKERADEPRQIIEEGKVVSVGELGVVAENVDQATSVPVEEGLDAMKLQGKDLDLPKSAEPVGSNKEPQQAGKKNGKKGKAKPKEEEKCKMS
ncbi:neurofilament heavy polypeptide isoform X3 [Centropristis striata]|uniref:neurofilament heavy polypeptide isoform X3 n=1 Tax=Centropristis striata TaxID=184440 RepID=UPI0027E1C43D|nr:neurofilament heavy polypeptide isoform X3 [Centropristis striata]